MNKTEFLEQLRQSLSGRVDAEQVSDNLRYYEDYIDSQLRQGMPEADVMMGLGSPRLIARSIMDAQRQGPIEEEEQKRPEETGWTNQPQGKLPLLFKFLALPRWLRYVIGFGIFFLILAILLCVLEFLMPVIALFIIAVFLVKLFRDWLN